MIIVLALLLVLLVFALGFSMHALWVVAAIFLAIWLVGLASGTVGTEGIISTTGEPEARGWPR